jgi:hypothetical protein
VQRDLPRLSPDPVVLDNDVPLPSALSELIYMVALPPAPAAAPPARRWA